eukprot:jgi/Galph1/86/GphlegSOOS_G4867.1
MLTKLTYYHSARLFYRKQTRTSSATFSALANNNLWADSLDYISFPREKEDNQYSVNWALAKIGVAPEGNVLYNPSARTLVASSPGKLTRERRLMVSGDWEKPKSFKLGYNLKPREYAKALKATATSLSQADDLFVIDGAIGSYPRSEVRIRTVTDSPSIALFLHHMLEPIPTRPISQIREHLHVYIHTKGNSTASLFSSSSCVLASERGQMLMDGSKHLYTLLQSTAELAADALFQTKQSILLRSVWKNNRLLLGNFEDTNGIVEKDNSDYGYYHHILSADGCSRAWKGCMFSASKASKTIDKPYSSFQVDSRVIVESLNPRPANLYPLPEACVIVNKLQKKGDIETWAIHEEDTTALLFLLASEALAPTQSVVKQAQALLSLLKQRGIPLYFITGDSAWQQAPNFPLIFIQENKSVPKYATKKYVQNIYGNDVLEQIFSKGIE